MMVEDLEGEDVDARVWDDEDVQTVVVPVADVEDWGEGNWSVGNDVSVCSLCPKSNSLTCTVKGTLPTLNLT